MSQLTLELISSAADTYEQLRFITLPVVSHVHKRIESFMYLDDIKSSAVGLDYFESSELNSKYNIFIADRSHQVPANSLRKVDSRQGFAKLLSASYSSSYSNVLISNQSFIDEFNKERPLFYKHKLPENTVSVNLEVVQFGNSVIVDTGYAVSIEDGAIYTNYSNYFNHETGNYKLYFITSTLSAGGQVKELLNPVPVVSEATWEDIDDSTGELFEEIAVYTKEKNTSGYTFYFNFADTWWCKPETKSLIRCGPPAGEKSDEPWYMRVSNGDISTIVNGAAQRYWLPEYLTQPFQPSFPYIYSAYNKMLYVNDKVITATRASLAIDPLNSRHVVVYIYDYEGNLLKIWTTNEGLSGTRFSNTDVYYETNKILCYDNSSGFVVFNESILPSQQFFAEYYYEADDLELTSLNLNPVQNKNLLNQSIVLYIVPNADQDDHGLHYLLVEADGYISYCSQSLGFSYPNLQRLNEDGTFNDQTIIGLKYISDIDDNTFVNLYTAGYENSHAYLILAEVNVLDRSSLKDTYTYDVRLKGNALTELSTEKFLKNPKALNSVYGYGEDGAVVALNNTVVIQVPLSVLTEYGGGLAEDKAVELVKKYLAAGTYPIIDWTYPWSEVSLEVSVPGEVTASWSWEGPDYTYRLYKRIEDVWILVDEVDSSTPTTFSYVDTDVVVDDVVYYEVRVVDGDIEYPAPYFNVGKAL